MRNLSPLWLKEQTDKQHLSNALKPGWGFTGQTPRRFEPMKNWGWIKELKLNDR